MKRRARNRALTIIEKQRLRTEGQGTTARALARALPARARAWASIIVAALLTVAVMMAVADLADAQPAARPSRPEAAPAEKPRPDARKAARKPADKTARTPTRKPARKPPAARKPGERPRPAPAVDKPRTGRPWKYADPARPPTVTRGPKPPQPDRTLGSPPPDRYRSKPPVRRRPWVVKQDETYVPRLWHIRLGVGANQIFVRDRSLDPLKKNDLIAMPDVSLEAEYTPFRNLSVMLQVGYNAGEFTDSLFQDYSTRTAIHSMFVGPVVGYRFWDGVMPYARGGFSATWTRVRILGGGPNPAGMVFGAGFYASGGIELSLPRRWMLRAFRTALLTFGLRIEAGYQYLGKFNYGGGSNASGLLDRFPAQLGSLKLHGASLRVGTVISF